MPRLHGLGLGSWGIVAIALPAIAIAGFLAASEPRLRTESFTLAFATEAPASLTSMSQRILGGRTFAGYRRWNLRSDRADLSRYRGSNGNFHSADCGSGDSH